MALEHAVVEDEVHEEVLVADDDALLPGLEAKAVAHFEQGVFEIGLAHDIAGAQAEKLEDVGIADDLGGREGFRVGLGHGGKFCLVLGESTAFVVEARDLSAKLADGPVAADGLDFGNLGTRNLETAYMFFVYHVFKRPPDQDVAAP